MVTQSPQEETRTWHGTAEPTLAWGSRKKHHQYREVRGSFLTVPMCLAKIIEYARKLHYPMLAKATVRLTMGPGSLYHDLNK